MFSLTLLDHLNLTFSQVTDRHKAHSAAADSYRKWNRRLRGLGERQRAALLSELG